MNASQQACSQPPARATSAWTVRCAKPFGSCRNPRSMLSSWWTERDDTGGFIGILTEREIFNAMADRGLETLDNLVWMLTTREFVAVDVRTTPADRSRLSAPTRPITSRSWTASACTPSKASGIAWPSSAD